MIHLAALVGLGLVTRKRHQADLNNATQAKETWIKRADELAIERNALQQALAQECQHSVELQRVAREKTARVQELEGQLKDERLAGSRSAQVLREIHCTLERTFKS